LPAIIGPDTKIYSLCFFPTNPFVQQGTTAAPTNYWLSVNAQTVAGSQLLFGWHTSLDSYNDVAVWGTAPFPPPSAWHTMADPQGLPLSMAFKINTATNQCPPPVLTCASNKTVECGTSWTFDPPTVIDPCCPTYSLATFDSTNGSCPQNISRVFVLTDCKGMTAVCTQTVSVLNTRPPSIACPPTKTYECGTPWTFDPPTVTAPCCGTNYTLYTLGMATNGTACDLNIARILMAVDCCGNQSITCTQYVRIVDTTPPVINCPSNRVVAICNSNAVVTWVATATDNCSTNITVTSSPPSGSTLARGTNTVVVTATDGCHNTNTCTFQVVVQRPVLTLSIALVGTNVVVSYNDGILQSSAFPFGPWADLGGASPPSYTTPAAGPYRFYRVRCP
jgi:hypothetical protein